ncbi:MAG: hypothetical protein QM765_15545 [Myxococcales bacterium]
MINEPVRATFTEFKLPSSLEPRDATVAIPVSNGMQQRYFFMNMQTGKGLQVCYPHRAGLATREALSYLEHLTTFVMSPNHWVLPRVRAAFRRFHNGISFFELLFKVLKPHGMTYLGNERFLISLWSASIFFVIDLKQRRMEMHMEHPDRRDVFSTYQYFDDEANETYFATQLGVDEWYKHDKEAIHYDVPVRDQEVQLGHRPDDRDLARRLRDRHPLPPAQPGQEPAGAGELRRLLRREAPADAVEDPGPRPEDQEGVAHRQQRLAAHRARRLGPGRS